jgi:hypothetical protein
MWKYNILGKNMKIKRNLEKKSEEYYVVCIGPSAVM